MFVGYDLHITRKTDWFEEDGPEITASDWLTYVATDKSIKLDHRAEQARDSGREVEGIEETKAIWIGWEKHEAGVSEMPIWHSAGNIVCKNPSPEMVRKMFLIADALDAKLQGEEGEEYDSTGEVVGGKPGGGLGKKKWWKFW